MILKVLHVCLALCVIGGCSAPQQYALNPPLEFEALDAPPGVAFAELGPHRIAYWDQGSGPLIVLIHGLGEHAGYWKQTIEALAKTHRVVAMDLLGYGRSDKPPTGYDIPSQAALVLSLMDAIAQGDSATVVGHSMGGQIALRLAISAPDAVNHLVLLAPAGIEAFTPGEGEWLKRVSKPSLFKSRSEAQLRAHFERNVFHVWSPVAEHHLQERIRLKGAKAFDAYLRAVVGGIHGMIDGPVIDELSEIKAPTTIVYGERDGLIPNPVLHGGTVAEVADAARKAIARSRVEVWPDVGHMIQIEAPEKTWALIREAAGG